MYVYMRHKITIFQIILELFMILKLEEVYLKTLKSVKVETADNEKYFLDLEASFGRNSQPIQPNCRLLEMNTTAHVPRRIKIELWNTENVSFHLNIVETNMALAKRRQYSFAYRGPFIGIDHLHSQKSFGLSLKQSHYSDQDEETNCINYPSPKFSSFQECDEDFIFGEMKKIGVMPFWAAKDKNDVTSLK